MFSWGILFVKNRIIITENFIFSREKILLTKRIFTIFHTTNQKKNFNVFAENFLMIQNNIFRNREVIFDKASVMDGVFESFLKDL